MTEKESKKKSKIEDLTDIELWEDMCYWVEQAQVRSPSFVDEIYSIIYKYLKEMELRLKNDRKKLEKD